MAFQRRADAKRDHRHAVLGTDAHDLLHLLGAFGKGDAIRRLQRNIGRGVRMLFAQRLPGLEALAEPLLEDAEHGGNSGFIACYRSEVAECHGFLRDWAINRPLSCVYE